MRKRRLFLQDVPYHVIVRGNNRRRLFSYPSDYRMFNRYLLQGVTQHPCAVLALCLMSNHVHMLLQPLVAETLSNLMHLVGMKYARYRNAQTDGSGKLFEERFHAFPTLSEAQLARVTAYIELNPVRAGLCQGPLDYAYSTYGLHVRRGDRADIPPWLWTPSEWYRELGSSPDARVAHYMEWIAEVRARDLKPDNVTELDILEAISNPDPWVRRPDGSRAA
jgi:putative transposase